MNYIYVLKLQYNKYYIGKTNNPRFRLEQHLNFSGCVWTKKYHPIKLIELVLEESNYSEENKTLEYMKIYGIHNVRGGSFCSLKLSNSDIITLEKMINTSTNKCFNCGKSGHYSNACNFIKTFYPEKRYKNNNVCYRCGRNNHYANNCYATTMR